MHGQPRLAAHAEHPGVGYDYRVRPDVPKEGEIVRKPLKFVVMKERIDGHIDLPMQRMRLFYGKA